MVAIGFKRASRKQSKLRLGLVGPSGSGKTYTALAIADTLRDGGTIAVLDSERGSASLYSDLTAFDVVELEHHSVEQYIRWIKEAGRAGYAVLVIDSLSHAWAGKGGILEFVDEAAKRNRSGSSFSAWRDATPKHNELVDTILSYPGHVIATMRAKTEYVQEKDNRGKTVIRKVGLQPVQRDGLEYEFTVVGDVTAEHELIVTKTRCSALTDAVIKNPGRQVAETLLSWLNEGEAPERPRPRPVPSLDEERVDPPEMTASDNVPPVDEWPAPIDDPEDTERPFMAQLRKPKGKATLSQLMLDYLEQLDLAEDTLHLDDMVKQRPGAFKGDWARRLTTYENKRRFDLEGETFSADDQELDDLERIRELRYLKGGKGA